jgi:hypothetical protein
VGRGLLYPLGLPAGAAGSTRPSGPHPPGYMEEEHGTRGRAVSMSAALRDGDWAMPWREGEKGGERGLTGGLGGGVRQALAMASGARARSSNQGARRPASTALLDCGGEGERSLARSIARR